MSVAEEAGRLSIRTGEAAESSRAGAIALAVLIGGISMLPLLLYVPFYLEPLLCDEGIYAATAQLMLDGKLPYEHAFDNKPPMIYAWYSLSFLLFGEEIWAPRLLVALTICLATLLMYFLAKLLMGRPAAIVASLVFAITVGLAEFDTNANTEFFMLLPLVAGFLCFTLAERSGSWGWYVGAGALMGVTIMTKEVTLFAYLLMFAIVANRLRGNAGWSAVWSRDFLRPAGYLAGGALAAGLVIIAPFVASGAFDDMFDAMVVYTLSYVGTATWPQRIEAVVKAPLYLVFLAGPITVLAYAAIWRLWRDRGEPLRLLLIGWAGTTFFGIVLAGRFYDHYYVLLFPALALLVPLGLRTMNEMRPRGRRLMAFAVAVSLVPMLVLNLDIYLQPTYADRHLAKFGNGQGLMQTQSEDLGNWLQERTTPDDYIYNFGFQSELYFYSDRQSPTRYLFDHPFAAGQEHIDRAIQELNANKPLYVVDSAAYEIAKRWQHYAWDIRDWIHENYDYVGYIYYADVYRLRDSGDGN